MTHVDAPGLRMFTIVVLTTATIAMLVLSLSLIHISEPTRPY